MTLPLCRDCTARSADCAFGELRLTQSCEDNIARSEKRFLYRQQRGGLMESLATRIRVNSLRDIFDFEQARDASILQLNFEDLECRYYAADTRVPEWSDIWIVTAKGAGVLGFTNGPVEGAVI